MPYYCIALFHHTMLLFQPSQSTKGEACQAQYLSHGIWGSWKWNYGRIYTVHWHQPRTRNSENQPVTEKSYFSQHNSEAQGLILMFQIFQFMVRPPWDTLRKCESKYFFCLENYWIYVYPPPLLKTSNFPSKQLGRITLLFHKIKSKYYQNTTKYSGHPQINSIHFRNKEKKII